MWDEVNELLLNQMGLVSRKDSIFVPKSYFGRYENWPKNEGYFLASSLFGFTEVYEFNF